MSTIKYILQEEYERLLKLKALYEERQKINTKEYKQTLAYIEELEEIKDWIYKPSGS